MTKCPNAFLIIYLHYSTRY